MGVVLFVLVFFFVSSSAWMAGLALERVPHSVDRSLGLAASEQVKFGQASCENPAAQRYVEDILDRLVAELDDSSFTFHVTVLDDPSINAFALPGGYVFVNEGLLSRAESGEELAGVLAHEISHVVLRHGVERILQSAGRRLLIGLVFGVSDAGTLLHYGGELRELSFGRDQESAADAMGHTLLRKAGISPRGLATFFERLDREGSALPEFLSTHPDSRERAAAALGAASTFTPTVTLPVPVPCHL